MKFLDIAPIEPEATGFFDFVVLGSTAGFIGLCLAVAAVAGVAAWLIVKALRKKK